MANTGKVRGVEDSFFINDIQLSIAPTEIKITKNSVNYQWQTLRTKSSQKTKSGHASIDIEFTVAFVGLNDINTKLRPLVAQLRYMPFCFVENSFLRQNIFPQEIEEASAINSRTTITLAIRAMSVTIQADTPGTIWATFQFSYFNYAPYMPLWQYKKDLFGLDSQKYVNNPANSLAWKRFITPAINETNLYRGIDSSAELKFLELRTSIISDVTSLEESRRILKQLQNNPKEFFNTLRTEVLDSPESTLKNAVKKNLSGFSNVDNIESPELILPIVIAASPRANPNSISFDRNGNYVNQDAIKQAMAQIDDRINAKVKSNNKVDQTISDGFELVKELIGQDNRGQSFGVFKKIRGLSLSKDNGIIITGITVSFQNILATIPILGQRYATFQHIGSIDGMVTFDIKAISEEALQNISWFYDTVNENMLTNRHIPQGMQTIRIHNNFLDLFNLHEFITNDMQVDTIPGSPGTYNLKLSLSESGLKSTSSVDNPAEEFRSEFGSSDPTVIKEVINVLGKNIKHVFVGETDQFITAVTDPRSSRLNSLTTKFVGDISTATNVFTKLLAPVSARVRNLLTTLEHQEPASSIDQVSSLNKFCTDIFDIVKSNPFFLDPLYSLTDNDVPGISKVQENISERFKRGVSGLAAISKNFSDKSLEEIIEDAKKNANTNDSILRAKAKQDFANQLNGQLNQTTPAVKKKSFVDQILTGDIPLQSSTAGTLGRALVTPPTTSLPVGSSATLENLISQTPFRRWNEFISNLSNSIVESTDINLPEFSLIKSMVNRLGLGRGLPAYDDFKFERIVNDDIDKLLSLDPDCFLYSKMDISIDQFIDPALISNAKLIANNSFNTAIDQVSKYYKDSWLPNAISDNIRNKVISNIKSGVSNYGNDQSATTGDDVDKAYYRGNIKIGDFYNATSQLGNKPIEVGGSTIDSQQIHSSFSGKTILTCANPPIMHSLDPNKLLTSPSSNAFVKSSNQHPGQPEPNSNGSDFAGGQQIYKPTDGELKIAGPTGHFQAARQIAEFGSDEARKTFVATHGRLHGGVDLQGDLGSNVYAVANGIIIRKGWDRQSQKSNAAGFAIIIQHIDKTKSYYFHMIEEELPGIRIGAQVKGGQIIGHIGRTAVGDKNTPTHLHMEFHDPIGIAIDPGSYLSITSFNGKKNIAVANYGPKNGPGNGITAGSTAMDLAIQNFNISLKNGQGTRLVRAFPAYKLYFIQDDSNNRRRFGVDDFFSYNAIVDITCIRSRKIPADLLEVTLTNVSGILSNRKFQGPRQVTNETPEGTDVSDVAVNKIGDSVSQDPNSFTKRDSKFENPLAAIMLQPGIDVELRLGNSNDPEKLTTVFVGKVMEVEFSESDDLVRIICQSHAIELVQDIKGMDKPIEKDGWFINDARTDRILESMMSEPEVIHFGRWVRSKTLSDGNSNRQLLTNKFSLTPTPQDDNIFVPPIEKLNELDNGWFFKNLQYSIFRTTIWDIFDEMTLRHPGWIKSTIPYRGKYGPRMTMFFGLPSQLYFAADPTVKEKQAFENTVANYKSSIDQLKDRTQTLDASILDTSSNSYLQNKLKDKDFSAERLQLAKDFQSIKPFRSYHLITSKNHIISNNIRASSKGTFNTVSIQYGQGKFNKETQRLIQSDYDILTLSVDAALPDEDIRELFVQYNNCQHKLLAKKYAVAILMRELKEVYKGEITITGNPDIKPYDIVYIFDDYSDIMGPVEVEQVIHRFSQDTGFITEITPDLFVVSNEWVNMTAADLMSVIIEGTTSTFNNGAPTFIEGLGGSGKGLAAAGVVGLALLSPLAAIVAGGAAVAGYFLLKKMVDFTSHGQPVVIHPLIHRGIPFVAGLPMTKLNNLWNINKGQWFKEGFEGISLALEDFNDKLTLAPSQGSIFNLFKGNTIPPKF